MADLMRSLVSTSSLLRYEPLLVLVGWAAWRWLSLAPFHIWRLAAVAGIVVVAVGTVWDVSWHQSHPMEVIASLAAVPPHRAVFAGFMIGLIGAGFGFIASVRRQPAAVGSILADPALFRHQASGMRDSGSWAGSSNDEDRILAGAIGELTLLHVGGRLVARALPENVYEVEVTVQLPIDTVIQRSRYLLSTHGRLLSDGQPATGMNRVRVIVGAGMWNMNPALITLTFSARGEGVTQVHVRGSAKEGLIKQHAGEGAAKRIAQLLTYWL